MAKRWTESDAAFPGLVAAKEERIGEEFTQWGEAE
jgi:hypothetical protein